MTIAKKNGEIKITPNEEKKKTMKWTRLQIKTWQTKCWPVEVTNKKLGSGIAGLSDHKAEETLAQDKWSDTRGELVTFQNKTKQKIRGEKKP